MRIITEDNIQQLENMSFSKNIDNLMFHATEKYDEGVDKVTKTITMIKSELKSRTKQERSSIYSDTMVEDIVKETVAPVEDEFKITSSSVLEKKPDELPLFWEKKFSEKYNRDYWLNSKTGETSWEKPVSIPGWKQMYSNTYKRSYWFNEKTGETSWEIPLKKGGEDGEEEEEVAFGGFDKLEGNIDGGSIESPLSKFSVGERV